jgi:hypothetical protein
MGAIELETDEEEEEERAARLGSDRYIDEDVDRTTDDVSGADEVGIAEEKAETDETDDVDVVLDHTEA